MGNEVSNTMRMMVHDRNIIIVRLWYCANHIDRLYLIDYSYLLESRERFIPRVRVCTQWLYQYSMVGLRNVFSRYAIFLFWFRVYSYSQNSRRGIMFWKPKVVMRRGIEGAKAQFFLMIMFSRLYINVVNIVNMWSW